MSIQWYPGHMNAARKKAAEQMENTDLVIEVNPRHVKYYQRMLGFKAIAQPRMDTRVQAEATLLHLDLSHAEREIARYGGKGLITATRSLYPFFFAPAEEPGIESRLRMFV